MNPSVDPSTPFVPAWLDDADLSVREFRVLCHLWRRAGAGGSCFPSGPAIATACRINRDTVWSVLSGLERKGLLVREKGAKNSNRYTLRVGGKEGVTSSSESAESKGRLEGVSHPETGGGRKEGPTGSEGWESAENRGWESAESEGCEGTPTKVLQLRFPKRSTKRERAAAPAQVPFPPGLSSPGFAAAWADWTQHRGEIRKPLTPTSVRQQLAKLEAIGEARAIEAIRHSISNGWQGIFEPKQDGRRTTGPMSREEAMKQLGGRAIYVSGYDEPTDISDL